MKCCQCDVAVLSGSEVLSVMLQYSLGMKCCLYDVAVLSGNEVLSV